MDQMELLWAFMQEDMKADHILSEIKRSPLRQKAEKARDVLMEQQRINKQLEEQVAGLTDRKDGITDAIKRQEEQLRALTERVEAAPPQTQEEINAFIAEAEKLRQTIASYETELQRIAKKATEHAGRVNKIRSVAAQAKQEFDTNKAEYEKESREKKAQLEKQRAIAVEKAVGISEKLMEEYNSIKKHIAPPLARLIGDSCSGCNTSQPSALLRRIEEGGDIVECETCGRMLIK